MKWTIAILLAGLCYSYLGCIQLPPCAKHYAFEFNISVTPKDTFEIGDTIWWEMNAPNQMFDKNSNTYIDLTNFELFCSFGISVVDSTVPITGNGQIHLFQYTEVAGRVEQYNNGLLQTYLMTSTVSDKYFKIGFIPTESGTYASEIHFPWLFFEKDADPYDELQIADTFCEELLTYDSYFVVNNKEMNYHMVEGTCRYNREGNRICYGSEEDVPNYGVYAFHVKEP